MIHVLGEIFGEFMFYGYSANTRTKLSLPTCVIYSWRILPLLHSVRVKLAALSQIDYSFPFSGQHEAICVLIIRDDHCKLKLVYLSVHESLAGKLIET